MTGSSIIRRNFAPGVAAGAGLAAAVACALVGAARAQSAPDLSYLAYYAYSEVPPDRNPADVILKSLKDDPIGAPIDEIKRASAALGLDFTFMETVARIEIRIRPQSNGPDRISVFISSVTTSSTNMDREALPMLATMPSRRPTSSRPRPFFLNWTPTRSRHCTTAT